MTALIHLLAVSLLGADLVPAPGQSSTVLKWEAEFVPGASPVLAENRRAGFALLPDHFVLNSSQRFHFSNNGRATYSTFRQPLPGIIRSYPGNPAQSRFGSIQVPGVYAGLDFQFAWSPQEELLWRASCSGLCDWSQPRIEIPQAAAVVAIADGLEIRFRDSRVDPPVRLRGALRVLGPNAFGFVTPSSGVTEVSLTRLAPLPAVSPLTAVDASGHFYIPLRGGKSGGIAKFDAAGAFLYASWLEGGPDTAEAQLLASPGQIYLAGPVQSAGALITPGALQSSPGGYYVGRLAPGSGLLLSSTYLGPPGRTRITASLLPQGDLVLLNHSFRAGFPTSANAWQPLCADPCRQAWAGRLNPALTRLEYGTWFPPGVQRLAVHTDGSIYFAGGATAGRLLAGTSRPLFERSFGATGLDEAVQIRVAPDESFWVQRFTLNIFELIPITRLDGLDGRTLATVTGFTDSIAVDSTGILHALTAGGCGFFYDRYSPSGTRLSRVTLPAGENHRLHPGPAATPLLELASPAAKGWFVLDPQRRRPPTVACLANPQTLIGSFPLVFVAPGMLVDVVGDGLLSDGEPTMSINGLAAPVLPTRDSPLLPERNSLTIQIPFEVTPFAPATLQLTSAGAQSAPFSLPPVQPVEPYIFPTILNENRTFNSPRNPAPPGAIITFWATGLGNTIPAMATGAVAPQRPQPLAATLTIPGLEILYAGAAPGLSSGITQINARVLPGANAVLSLDAEVRLGDFTRQARTRVPVYTREPFTVILR